GEGPTPWQTGWRGGAAGALIVPPLGLAGATPSDGRVSRVEMVSVLLAVAGISALTLSSRKPIAYLIFPALLWAALRLGRRGATVAVAIAAGFAISETSRRVGPFALSSMPNNVLATQLFIAVSAISTL